MVARAASARNSDKSATRRVTTPTYVGTRMEYFVMADFGSLFVTGEDVEHPLEVGREIRVGFAGNGAVLIPNGADAP